MAQQQELTRFSAASTMLDAKLREYGAHALLSNVAAMQRCREEAHALLDACMDHAADFIRSVTQHG